ncbi:EamA family transporter [Vaginella massiliensis]|uniref:EamA family transporter n=1 Tax=Vaginella massiliensis TaxID=1816680 RepID=UPI0008389B70|nr:EamA family transporter [Vaginella massiliensis]
MKQSNYFFAALLTYFMWGFFSFGLRPISDYPSMDILYYRLFFSTVLLLLVGFGFRKKRLRQDLQLFRAQEVKVQRQMIYRLVGGSLVLMSNWLVFIYVMNHVSVQTASLSYLICPIVTTLLSVLILKEKISSAKWFAIGLSTLACAIMSLGHFRELYFSLFVALSFATYIIVQKRLSIFDSFNLLMLQLSVVSIILLPFYFWFSGPFPTEIRFFKSIALVVLLFTTIPMILNNFALKGIDSSTVGILIYINPIINFLLAVFYYKEQVSTAQIVAYSLIFVSIIIFNAKFLFKTIKKSSV